MKKYFALLILLCSILNAQAQDEETSSLNAGLGLGLDYGGIGSRISVLPSKKVALFAGLGYNFDGLGFNGGVSLRLSPDTRLCPSLIAMYGYNAVLIVEDAPEYSKTYYGPTFGFELEIKSRRSQNFFNIGLLLPIRSQEFQDDADSLIDVSDLLPVTISLGYHFAF